MRRLPILALVIVLFAIGLQCGRMLRTHVTVPSGRKTAIASPENAGIKTPVAIAHTLSAGESIARLKRLSAITNEFDRTRAVSEIADQLDEAQIREALAELEHTHFREHEDIISRLLLRWAKLNPRAAVDYAISIRSPRQRGIGLAALDEVKVATSPAYSPSAERSPDSTPPATTFADRLHDALSIPTRGKRERAIAAMAEGMTIEELRDGLQRLEKIHVRERARIRTVLLARWGQLDPEGAIEYAASLPNIADRSPAVCVVIGRWVGKDPRAAEAWVVALARGAVKIDALTALVEGLAVNEPHRALQLARDITPRFGVSRYGNLVPALFDKWIDDDPASAADAAAKLPASVYFRGQALQLIASRWAEKDFDRAMAWVSDRSAPQTSAITGLLSTWLAKDSDAAIAWLNEYPDGDVKLGLVQSMASNFSDGDPALAARLALAIPPGSIREQAIEGAVCTWVSENPAAAVEWAFQQDEETIRRVALRRIAFERMTDDSEAARAWITSLPGGAVKDTMLRDAARMIVEGSNPPIARMSPESIQNSARILSEISDAQIRMAACTSFAAKWLSRDEPTARIWIETLPLSPADKVELFKAKPKP
jgi:hypothetical protein